MYLQANAWRSGRVVGPWLCRMWESDYEVRRGGRTPGWTSVESCPMPTDFASMLLLVVTSAITFTIARLLSRNWRKKRREREEAEKRANESRQVRRARERQNRN
jgi:hypothetical protein